MNSFRSKPLGWRYESQRHFLAAKGIKTKQMSSGVVGHYQNIVIKAAPLPAHTAYPVTPGEVKDVLKDLPKEDMKNIKQIEFVPPRDARQESAWAQFLRGRKTMLIFGQKTEDGKISGKDAKEVREHMKRYVIPHEMGHAKALHDLPTDKRLSLAEARADGYAFGFSVEDPDVKQFEKFHR
jgi:hypothetical protein